MRVLDSRPLEASLNKEMVKKRQKNRQQDPENTSDEEENVDTDKSALTKCKHVNRSVNLGMLKKGLKHGFDFGKCTNCKVAGVDSKRPVSVSIPSVEASPVIETDGATETDVPPCDDDEPPAVYMCLLCGHQGCDRNSEKRHALVHYETPRSQYHEVALNTCTWQVWCYACDDFLDLTEHKRLMECVDFIRKLSSNITQGTDIQANKGSVNSAARNKSLAIEAVQNKRQTETNVADSTSQGAVKEKDNSNTSKASAKTISDGQTTFQKVKGLTNLGNTCFFNAVMQNLSQTHLLEVELRDYSVKGKSVAYDACPSENSTRTNSESGACQGALMNREDGMMTIHLGEAGEMCRTLVRFFDEMNKNENYKQNCVNPSELLGQVCKKAPRFKGFQQQDSHELLHYLLDGIKAEETKRSRSGILKAMNLSDNVKPENVPENERLKIKAFSSSSRHTFVDRVFGGYFINTVVCEQCNTHHQIFESFLDISLPIIDEKTSKQSQNNGGGKKSDDKSGADPDWIDSNAIVNKPSKNLSKKQQKAQRKTSKLLTKKLAKSGGKKNEEQVSEGVNEKVVSQNTDVCKGESNDLDERRKSEDESTKHDKSVVLNEEGEDENVPTVDRESPMNVSKNSNQDSSSTDADVEDNEESDAHKFKSLNSSNVGTIVPVDAAEDEPRRQEDLISDVCDRTVVSDTSSKLTSEITEDINSAYFDDDSAAEITKKFANVCIEKDEDGDVECSVAKRLTGGVSVVNTEHTPGDNVPESLHRQVACGDSSNSCIAPTLTAKCKSGTSASREGQAVSKQGSYWKSQYEEECQRARRMATGTLIPRQRPTIEDRSVTSCLYQFTVQELLTGNNMFICSTCNENKHDKKSPAIKTCASKQMLIFSPPSVLTLHLKRFQQVGFNLRKDSRHVQFSDMLDLAPYCSALCQNIDPGQKQILYSLFGVVEHVGTMRGGHYTAYVKVRQQTTDAKKYLQTLSMGQLTVERLVETLRLLQEHETMNEAASEHPTSNVSTSGKWFYVSDNQVREVGNNTSVLSCQAYLLFYERVF